jgi:hypothetical protein
VRIKGKILIVLFFITISYFSKTLSQFDFSTTTARTTTTSRITVTTTTTRITTTSAGPVAGIVKMAKHLCLF